MDGSGSNSPELEAVTLRLRDIVKLKETVQNVLVGISKEPRGSAAVFATSTFSFVILKK